MFSFVHHAGTSAKLTLKKIPTADKTFAIPIEVKDRTGMGITHGFNGEIIL